MPNVPRTLRLTLAQALVRFLANQFTEIARSKQRLCGGGFGIFGHGNVIRYFVMKALGIDTRSWLHLSRAHTSITIIEVRGVGSLHVLSVGDIGHVPPDLQSWGTNSDPTLAVPH